MAEAIQALLDVAASGRPGRGLVALKYLKRVDRHIAAFLAIRRIIDSIGSGRVLLQTVAVSIGRSLEDEERFTEFQKQHPGMFKRVLDDLKRRRKSTRITRA